MKQPAYVLCVHEFILVIFFLLLSAIFQKYEEALFWGTVIHAFFYLFTLISYNCYPLLFKVIQVSPPFAKSFGGHEGSEPLF